MSTYNPTMGLMNFNIPKEVIKWNKCNKTRSQLKGVSQNHLKFSLITFSLLRWNFRNIKPQCTLELLLKEGN